jgi:signal transduction histidine kinase
MTAVSTICCPNDSSYLTGTFFDWFTGDGRYHTLYDCMGGDIFWIVATVTLDLAVACGYILIARHWWKNQRLLGPSPARTALGHMRNIFLFCGICGYVFIPIKMFWPAWRLYDGFMLFLVYFTWKYAWNAKNLKVIYEQLGRSDRLEKELVRSREESNRKGFFLNAISHDLRTPLNSMMLQVNVAELSARSGDSDALSQALADMKTSARATSHLLDTLLEFARADWAADSNSVTRFRVRDVVQEIVDQHHAAAKLKGLDLQVDCPDDLLLSTDRTKFGRVLTNLVNNAVKFTQSGSVRVEVEQYGRALRVHVIDTGIGLSPQSRERLFEEFFQVSNHERDRRKGFGLGLAISRRLARQLGGDVLVESAEGKGSRFTVTLADAAHKDPTAAARVTAGASNVAVSSGVAGNSDANSAVAAER